MSPTPTPQKPQWPTPITDRLPCEADADKDGYVQWFNRPYGWLYSRWERVARDGDPWLHTPQWEPRVTREEAEAALGELEAWLHRPPSVLDYDNKIATIRTYIRSTAT